MNRYTLRVFTLIVVSVLVAILLASALNGFTRVSDPALAQISPPLLDGGGQGGGYNAPRPALKNYLPVIFLNSATAGGAWLLSGNAGTNPATDFLGTTDKITLTMRVSNTVAFRIAPAVDPTNGFAPNVIGGFGGNTVAPSVYGATIGGGGVGGFANNVNANYAAVGGGAANTAGGNSAFVGGGNFNTASNSYATVGGGYGNTASGNSAFVGGGNSNTASGITSTIAGGQFNIVLSTGAMIGAGSSNTIPTASSFAFIGGGFGNTASSHATTIGGGQYNLASNLWATVGGGEDNTASGNEATVGGGFLNTASEQYATVGGGSDNTASGYAATVPGGYSNVASGIYSFAAGRLANTNNMSGAFVWADSTGIALNATAANQFLVRATGGVGIGTNAPSGQLDIASSGGFGAPQVYISQTNSSECARLRFGVALTTTYWDIATGTSGSEDMNIFRSDKGNIMALTPNGSTDLLMMSNAAHLTQGGAWTNASDRNVKANFQNVDSRDILARVMALPITTWNYNAEPTAVRHLGPMAQDFYAAFNLGADDKSITTVDESGVALAAIQGLAQENNDLKAQVASVQAQNASLKEQFATYQDETNARLTALEQGTGQTKAFTSSNLPLWGIVGLLALVLVRRRK